MHCSRCGHDTMNLSGTARCQVCGNGSFDDTGSTFSSTIYSRAIPWESPVGKIEPLKAIVQTVIASFTKNDVFFSAAARSTGSLRAILYGLCMGSIGIFATAFWETISPYSMGSILAGSGIFRHATDSIAPQTLMATPLVSLIQIYSLALYCHSMLWITRNRKMPFRATLNTVCYTQGAALFQLIPVVGVFFSFFATLYLLINGIHIVHETSRFKTFLVLVFPVILFLMLSTAFFFLLILVMTLSGMGQFDPFSLFRF